MKKLILLALFVFATFMVAQSQSLQYALYNNSNNTWNYKMDDAGPSPAVYELNILPTQQRNGFIFNFALPLEWAAENAFGCYTTQLETGPINTVLNLPCFPAASIEYKLVPFGFGNWGLKMAFN